MPRRLIYMDHHATTPMDPRVVEAMLPFFTEQFGNAASRHHAYGWAARDAVARARKQIALLVDCDPREVIFTSGATESNNLALKGCAAEADQPARVVTAETEHRSVLDACRSLEARGARVTLVSPQSDGRVRIANVERALAEPTTLVSVMTANNEIGVLQPVGELAALAHRHGALFHTDATQAIGKVTFSVRALDVDLASFSAHKLYGPKGVGALVVRKRRPPIALMPLLDGGGHERGLRSGTLNVPGIVGFGRAADIAREEMAAEAAHVGRLRDHLRAQLSARIPGVRINGTMTDRLPHNLNVSVPGVEGESLLVGLEGVALSSGAACTSSEPGTSHVLRALGVPEDLARASLRFGLGRGNTEDDIDNVVEKISKLVERLRRVNGAAAESHGLSR